MADLRTISALNFNIKFADDTNLLVSETTTVNRLRQKKNKTTKFVCELMISPISVIDC